MSDFVLRKYINFMYVILFNKRIVIFVLKKCFDFALEGWGRVENGKWASSSRVPGLEGICMVLILDGSSWIDAHVRRNLC